MPRDLKYVDIIIGRNVKTLRLMRGLSQVQLAEALGLTFQQIQKYETAANRISASRLVEIARILDVESSALLPDAARPSPPAILTKEEHEVLKYYGAIANPTLRASIMRVLRALH